MFVSRRARCCAASVLVLVCGLTPEKTSAGGKRGDASQRGQHLFEVVWKPQSEPEPAGDGLGPLFNERSCVGCHFLGGIGGAGPLANNVELLTAGAPRGRSQAVNLQTRLSSLHPAFASSSSIVLHRFGIDPFYEDFRARLAKSNRHAPRVVSTKTIRTNGITLLLTSRNTTPLFGAGMIDSISREEIEKVAARQAKEDVQVRGRFLGRFGWRGQTNQLSDFIRGACAVELGLQVRNHQQAANPLPGSEKPMASNRFDMTEQECDELTEFVAGLPAPRRIEPTDPMQAALLKNGEGLFHSVGCTVCHRPQLGSVQGIFSDLLVHNMGPDLSDAAQAPAPPFEPDEEPPQRSSGYGGGSRPPTKPSQLALEQHSVWKTPPLWGVADSGPYLHDGRAATIEEAILLHGGEASYSVQCFRSLSSADQSRILGFLLTLAAPEPSKLPRPQGASGWGKATASPQRRLPELTMQAENKN